MKKRLLIGLFLVGFVCVGFYQTANASFFFTRYQNQRVGGENINKTSTIVEQDWGLWSFGTEVGTADRGYLYVVPYTYRALPFLGKGWQGGVRFEHDSLQSTSVAPSIRYAGVKEIWPKKKFLFLLQVDYFLGDQERADFWGNITYLSFGQLRIGAEGYFQADKFGRRNYQLRPLRLGYRLHGFGLIKAVTPFIMFEHRWDGWEGSTVESNSGFFGVVLNW